MVRRPTEADVRRITERVSSEYLNLPPTRPLPWQAALEIVADFFFERPLRSFFDPLLLLGLVLLIMLRVTQGHPLLWLLALAVVAWRVSQGSYRLWRQASDEIALLRKGLLVQAHILKLRPHRSITGEIEGALLDCAIPVAERRTYVGSIWLADGNEAQRLSRQGRLSVICLPRTPGTWRVVEPIASEVRYERMGPVQAIPKEA